MGDKRLQYSGSVRGHAAFSGAHTGQMRPVSRDCNRLLSVSGELCGDTRHAIAAVI